jgi:hypothetical protein
MFTIANTKVENIQLNDILPKLPFVNYADRDLKDSITACSIKSLTGRIQDLHKSFDDNPEDYIYTKLYGIPEIKRIVDFFEFETTRIRIFKQLSGKTTPYHIDEDNDNIIRIIVPLTYTKGMAFIFDTYYVEADIGEIIFFNPNSRHGSMNRSKDIRYSLHICGISNDWLGSLISNV